MYLLLCYGGNLMTNDLTCDAAQWDAVSVCSTNETYRELCNLANITCSNRGTCKGSACDCLGRWGWLDDCRSCKMDSMESHTLWKYSSPVFPRSIATAPGQMHLECD